MVIDIPNYKSVDIRHVVLDYNGTVAKDGKVDPEALALMRELSTLFSVYVVTADTFGTVEKELEGTQIVVKVLTSDNHTEEKARFVDGLGPGSCVAVGNGNNDMQMLSSAALGIAVVGAEGCSTKAILASDLVCGNIVEVLELLKHPKRLVATLRR
ncbi:HAD family hydrolase [Hydrogenimonas sp.]